MRWWSHKLFTYPPPFFVSKRACAHAHMLTLVLKKVPSPPATRLSHCSFGIVGHIQSLTLKHCVDMHGGHYPLAWLTGVRLC